MSLGGSVIVPDKVDINFIKNFIKIINRFVKKNYRFVIYCGGGMTARNYQKAASRIIKLKNEDLDWLGIHATRLNAHFIKTLFGNIAENIVINDPTINNKSIIFFNKSINNFNKILYEINIYFIRNYNRTA